MVKKLLSICLAGAMLSATVATAAELGGAEHKALQALGIAEEKLSSKISYDAFLNALMGFMYEPGERPVDTETFAKSTGMIGTVQTYNGKENISLGEAVKFSVIALGCGIYIQDGDAEQYISVGATKGLMKGIDLSADEILDKESMLTLLYNLMDAAPLKYEDDGYAEATDETLLSMYRDIHVVEGLLSADERTSIYSETGVNEGEIMIGDSVFTADGGYDASLLGKNVVAFVRDNGRDEPSLVYVSEDEGENRVLTVDAKEIDSISDDFRTLEYFEEYNGRVKTAKLAGSISVIYNGVFYGDYTAEDLIPENGSLTLIDTDKDNKYDILNVTSYQTMVVDVVNATNKIVSNKYNHEGVIDILDLDPEKGEVDYTVIKNGQEISFAGIQVNDVLNVAMSKSGETPVCTVYVSSEAVETVVISNVNDDNEIETEEDTYRLSSDYIKYMEQKSESLKIGESYLLYLDAFGNIAYSRKISSSEYALLFKVTSNEDVEEEVYVKYMNIDGDWFTSKCAKRVNTGEKNVYPSDIFKSFKGADPQVVILKTNEDGEVSKIVKAKETNQYLEGTFTKTKETQYTYRSGVKTFSNQLYITSDTYMFVMAEKSTGNTDDYYVVSANDYFSGDTNYTVSAYDIDNFGYTELLSIKEDSELRSNTIRRSMFVVTDLSQALTPDGDVSGRITGSGGGLRNISLLTENDELFSQVKTGDVINFNVSRNGRINNIKILTNISEPFRNKGISNYHVGSDFIMGTVSDIDLSNGRIKINTGSETAFPLGSGIACIEYNGEEYECEHTSSYDLMKGDNVICRISWSGIAEIIRVVE